MQELHLRALRMRLGGKFFLWGAPPEIQEEIFAVNLRYLGGPRNAFPVQNRQNGGRGGWVKQPAKIRRSTRSETSTSRVFILLAPSNRHCHNRPRMLVGSELYE